MRFFRKIGATLAIFSLYVPSLICFPAIILCEAYITSPPDNVTQDISDLLITMGMVLLAIRLMVLIYRVRRGRYSHSQSKRIIFAVSLVALLFIAGTAFGFIVVSPSWALALFIIAYFVYGMCLIGILYKNHLVPEGFIKESREQ